MASTHFQLNQPVKTDGVDFEPGVYPIEEIDAGRRGSICNARWGDYCDAPKAKAKAADVKAKTDDDDDDLANDPDGISETQTAEIPTPAKPKPARSRKK
ncbi:MAG: hypothetical protein ACOVLE_10860 [Pirellula staleyi]